jgi:Asp/Glu/hydantoin racemase
MADQAVQIGRRIGVIATLPTTLEPTSDLVSRRAARAGRPAELTARLCEGAFDALMSGDATTHDAIVAAALRELSGRVDVILLAQASMARVVDTLPAADRRVPILASPPIAIDYLATVL